MEKYTKMFFEYLKNEKKSSENTIMSYMRDVKYFIQFVESKGISELVEVDNEFLSLYVEYLKEQGKATSTISRHIASVRSFYSYLIAENIATINPAKKINLPKVKRQEINVMSMEEVVLLMSMPSTEDTKGIRDKAMIEVLYATGIKVSELIHLSVDNVDMTQGVIDCKISDRPRIISFGERTKKALEEYISTTRSALLRNEEYDTLFLNCSGTPMTRQGFWKILKKYAKMAGLENDITPHTFRHSVAVHMLKSGVDLEVVQKRLGHTTSSTTQSYFKLVNEIKNSSKDS